MFSKEFFYFKQKLYQFLNLFFNTGEVRFFFRFFFGSVAFLSDLFLLGRHENIINHEACSG